MDWPFYNELLYIYIELLRRSGLPEFRWEVGIFIEEPQDLKSRKRSSKRKARSEKRAAAPLGMASDRRSHVLHAGTVRLRCSERSARARAGRAMKSYNTVY